MDKELHGVEFDGTTFGMCINTDSAAYDSFKKAIQSEECIDIFGEQMKSKVFTVPYKLLAPIMGHAGFLVREKYMNKIVISGLKNDAEIYVKYSDKIIDFRERFHKEFEI